MPDSRRAVADGGSSFGLDQQGLQNLGTVHWNLTAPYLYEHAVRRGEGPHLLHVRTYRITGHTSTDAAAWRPDEEVAEARARDPIARLGAVLAERGIPATDLGKIIDEAKAEMATARKEANEAAWPEPHVAYEDVQDTGAVAPAASS